MLMADVLSIALSIVGFFASMQGLWLVLRALAPRRMRLASQRLQRSWLRCLIVGVLTTALVVIVATVVGRRLGTFGQLAGFAVSFAFAVYANIGTCGLATLIGQRLDSPSDDDRPWRATVRGGVALELAWLTPLLGWFGLLPLSWILGAGAVTLSFFGRSTEPAAVNADAPTQSGRQTVSYDRELIEVSR